ncbi:hypothetical protein LRP31_34325 (plasmid) [Mesorhizobium mediterraneum]|uniref:hypothetical protein n=1 Tax=Mesorhizobium TaxID=68287 RepID=UPI001FD88998|nr:MULTISPECIES: hypothetical protein [Mesorhizobium]WIW57180.1 hypothetical protein LRP31_34325 [Mesorhizobium mediterraneum]
MSAALRNLPEIKVSVDKPAWLLLAGRPMRGRGWIKALRQDEARQVRARIAELERDLIAPTPQGRHRRLEAGHELRNAKSRLARLEECISGNTGETSALAGSFAALNACSRTSSLCCGQIDP